MSRLVAPGADCSPGGGVSAGAEVVQLPPGMVGCCAGGGGRGRRVHRRFLEVLEFVLGFLFRRNLRRVVPELRVCAVLAVAGRASTMQVAEVLGLENRLVKDWLDMAADDGLILECGWMRAGAGASGLTKVWRLAPDGVALLREALEAWDGHDGVM